MSISLSPDTLSHFSALLSEAMASRYLSAAGLTVLLYDHLLTFPAEVALVWKAPRSWPKYGFLLNRYMVPSTLILIAYEICGFVGPLTDLTCRRVLFATSIIAVCSIGIANALVLVRLILLWENNRRAKCLLTGGFIFSFASTCSLMVITLLNLWDGLRYNPIAKMCVTERTTPTLIGVWASPMAFEVLVLVATCWNALDRPTEGNLPLLRALRRDGILYFLAMAAFRSINLALAATTRPDLVLLLVFFIWSMTTLILNRSLLDLEREEALENLRVAINNLPRMKSPFGTRPEHAHEFDFQRDDLYDELVELQSSKRRSSDFSSRWFEP